MWNWSGDVNEYRKKLRSDMIEEGKLSEFNQKAGNQYMYQYHHGKYMEMIKLYKSIKP